MKKNWLSLLFAAFAVTAAFGLSSCAINGSSGDSGSDGVNTENSSDGANDEIEEVSNEIRFKTLSVDGLNVYGKVSNATATFSFKNEVETFGESKYIVSLDMYGSQQVVTKTIPLSVGDNTAYIIEMLDGESTNIYTVTIRRKPIYVVAFDTDGGTAVESQTIEEDGMVAFPNEPTKTGYTFTGWEYDFSMPVTNAVTVKAKWTANIDTAYKVEYYLENLEDNGYTLKAEATEELAGTTDSTVRAEIKTFAHFTHKATATDSGKIAPDGSTVLRVYYTRDMYTVTFSGNGGALSSGYARQTVKYGGTVVAPTYKKRAIRSTVGIKLRLPT